MPDNLDTLDAVEIKTAYDRLRSVCGHCWAIGNPDYSSHRIDECTVPGSPNGRNRHYQKWRLAYKFPNGTCFGCGMSQSVSDDVT